MIACQVVIIDAEFEIRFLIDLIGYLAYAKVTEMLGSAWRDFSHNCFFSDF